MTWEHNGKLWKSSKLITMSITIQGGGLKVYDLAIQPAEKHQHLCPGTQETLNAAKFASEKHKRIGYLIEEISNQFSHASRSSLF